jgi:hypothetical protein
MGGFATQVLNLPRLRPCRKQKKCQLAPLVSPRAQFRLTNELRRGIKKRVDATAARNLPAWLERYRHSFSVVLGEVYCNGGKVTCDRWEKWKFVAPGRHFLISWFDGAFHRQDRLPNVRPSAAMSFRHT